MSSDQQLQSFRDLGYCRVERAFPVADAARMRDLIWHDVTGRLGIDRANPATWTVDEPRGFQHLSRANAFAAIATPAFCAAVDAIMGRPDWPRPREWAQPLVTFGSRAAWQVPHQRWHIDFPAKRTSGPALGLKWLAYLSSVRPGGGGTLVVAGSHWLVARYVAASPDGDRGASGDVRAALAAAHPWFERLTSNETSPDRAVVLMDAGATIDGVQVRVVELTGEPGDVVLFDPWLFHAPAPNTLPEPRMMLTGGLVARD